MPAKRRVRPLDEFVAYRNPQVVNRFLRHWILPRREAERVFADLMRYLWLIGQPGCGDVAPVAIVDEMWHMFLVFTEEYQRWSEHSLGYFLHHRPRTAAQQRDTLAAVKRSPRGAREAVERGLVADIAIVADKLGDATALRWYVLYESRYGKRFFNTRRRPRAGRSVKFPKELVRQAEAASDL
ncbi:MAG TPA: hypothetical protein VLX92_12900 [Kofleriaceae bacterium]|nr:hypothetical protein [Kofleriaceae bacterium]